MSKAVLRNEMLLELKQALFIYEQNNFEDHAARLKRLLDRIEKPKHSTGPKKKVLQPAEIQKINMLWFVNGRTRSDICRVMHYSPSIVDRTIFPTRREWEDWEIKAMSKGEL